MFVATHTPFRKELWSSVQPQTYHTKTQELTTYMNFRINQWSVSQSVKLKYNSNISSPNESGAETIPI
jgi:hypothetical protein